MSAGASGAIAAAAAAAAARREREEEEKLTGYTQADLADGWEFKILRSATGAFRKPERLHQILEEEARAGWVLVEKFDSQRVRLKRPASARNRDPQPGADPKSGIDPYRTTCGIGDVRLALLIVGGVLGTLAAAAVAIILATR